MYENSNGKKFMYSMLFFEFYIWEKYFYWINLQFHCQNMNCRKVLLQKVDSVSGYGSISLCLTGNLKP